MRVTGPSLSKRKTAVRILEDVNDSIQKYMLMLLTTSLVVALLTWIAFRWIGATDDPAVVDRDIVDGTTA